MKSWQFFGLLFALPVGGFCIFIILRVFQLFLLLWRAINKQIRKWRKLPVNNQRIEPSF